MKNGVFWVVTPCGSCKNLTRATRRNIPEDTILQRIAAWCVSCEAQQVLHNIGTVSMATASRIYSQDIHMHTHTLLIERRQEAK
jgi:hypothetical protein